MDDPDLTFELDSDDQLVEQGSRAREQSTSAFFSRSKQIGISGGIFTNNITNIHQHPTNVPSDFRMIPLGDLNLLREIRLDSDCGSISRRQGRSFFRKVYSAWISGGGSNMTVAVYQGGNAEKEWREAISTYANLRHPNIIQVYGVTVCSGIYATVFHDDLIPWKHVEKQYRSSPIAIVYVWYFASSEYTNAVLYVSSVTGNFLQWHDVVFWIRPSAGRLCVELAPDARTEAPLPVMRDPYSQIDLLKPDQASKMINPMSLADYHDVCASGGRWYRYHSWDVSSPVKLGSVRAFLMPTYKKSIELAFTSAPPNSYSISPSWHCNNSPSWRCNNCLIMENGWTRVHPDMEPIHAYCSISACSPCTVWLSQADYIFSCLNVTSNHQRAVLVYKIWYSVKVLQPGYNIPRGFLFLCPMTDFRMENGTVLQDPDSVAYWSLDPAGIERLSTKDANHLGFPAIELKMTARGYSWDGSIYEGLRKFHRAKGFNPGSQDVARHLGYPLFEVSPDVDPQFAFTYEEDSVTSSVGCNDEGSEGNNLKFIYKRVDRNSSDERVQVGNNAATPKETYELSNFESTEPLQPSPSLTIIMLVQSTLILTLGAFWLYDNFFTWQL